jgi:Na+/phosphate symporter
MARLRQVGLAVVGVALFICALELLKRGASGLQPLLTSLNVRSVKESIAFGWLMAYLVLSGSPVAAISLTLFSGGAITDIMSLAMITGSRLGASFIVLFVGFMYHLRGHRRVASISIGVLTLFVTASIYLPALALGLAILRNGWLDSIRFGRPAALSSALDYIFDPVVAWLAVWAPYWVIFVLGVAMLLTAFKAFDAVLPEVDPENSRFGNVASFVYRPMIMFLVGAAFTSFTLSVSVSLTLLVPLATRGYIRRENIIPYIMGANITTFLDTLFASMLLATPRAFTIVLVEIITVGAFSLAILALGYNRYQRAMNGLLYWVLYNNVTLAFFLLAIVGIPILLLFS